MNERRYDPTSDEWVTFAPDRQERTHHPDPQACPLCPTRPGAPPTEILRPHFDIAVFDNRFPALIDAPDPPRGPGTALTPVTPAFGRCEVVVYSDDHAASLATVGLERLTLLIDVWAQRTAELGRVDGIAYVMPFENRGREIGVTLSHPHGQIYAYPDIPPRPARELAAARKYRARSGSCVWCDVVVQEQGGERVVVEGEHWLAAVPFWARWPYQIEIWCRRHLPDLPCATAAERADLAWVLQEVVRCYDALWGFPLALVLVVHQRPTDGGAWEPVSHLHLELDPAQRSADRLKHLAGSELGAGSFLNDVLPEVAAARLRTAR